MPERRLDGRAVRRVDFEDVAQRRAAVRRGKHLPQHVEPAALLRGLRHRLMVRLRGGGQSAGNLRQFLFARRQRGVQRAHGLAQFGQAVVERRQPLGQRAALVFEIQFFRREPFRADHVVLLFLIERVQFIAIAGALAFEVDQRGLGLVQRGVLLGQPCLDLFERILLRLELGLFGGEHALDLVELGIEDASRSCSCTRILSSAPAISR